MANRQRGHPEMDSGVDHDARRLRTGIAWTLALAVLLVAIGLAVPDLRNVLHRVADASIGWLIAGIVLELLSCLGYVATVRLVLNRGPKREVRRLAWAEMAFGAVVPVGGAGGLAVGAWAMRAWGISWSRIANRSAVIFLLTSAVNCAVLGIAGLFVWFGVGSAKSGLLYGLLPAAVGLGAIAFFLSLPRVASSRFPRRLRSPLEGMASWVSATEEYIFKPHWRLLGAIGYLLFDIAVLWVCLRAVSVHAPVMAMVAAYQIGYMANIVPIPGGLGVLDGGLLAALVLYGVSGPRAAAGVILYHAIALWLPTIGGTIGFLRLRGVVVAQSRQSAAQSDGGASERPESDGGSSRSDSDGGSSGPQGEGLLRAQGDGRAAAHATAD